MHIAHCFLVMVVRDQNLEYVLFVFHDAIN